MLMRNCYVVFMAAIAPFMSQLPWHNGKHKTSGHGPNADHALRRNQKESCKRMKRIERMSHLDPLNPLNQFAKKSLIRQVTYCTTVAFFIAANLPACRW
jgi:hypothetical protein